MKSLIKSFWIVLISVIFIFSGCNNIYNMNAVMPSSSQKISVSVTSENNLVSFPDNNSGEARLITPQAYNFNSNLDFYLWGTNLLNTSDNITRQQITISATDSNHPSIGTFDFNFEKQFYRLYLVALPHGTPYQAGAEVLSSSIAIDLRKCSDISFYLSTRQINATGNVELAVYADGWTLSNEYQLTAGIYTQEDNYTVSETILSVFPNYSSTPSNPDYQFTADNIEQGTYNFILTASKTFEGRTISFKYSDTINILPNQTTKAVLAIPDIIVETPAQPSYLIAGYVDTEVISSNFYDVEFCWDDPSYNETDFQLQLLDISDLVPSSYNTFIPVLADSFSNGNLTVSQDDMDQAWQAVVLNLNSSYVHTYTRSYFENTNIKTDGSFTSNSVYAVLKLLYGKRYFARIRAVNSSGASNYTYLDLYNTGNRSFAATNDANFNPSNFDSDASSVNRYKIEYYFTNGIFYDDSTNDNVSDYISACKITSQKRHSAENLLQPVNYDYDSGSTATLKYLYNSTYYNWLNWKIESNAGTDYSSTSYDGHENLYLYAYYGPDIQIQDIGLIVKSSTNDYENSDIVISAHPETATSLIPFQQDTDISESLDSGSLTVSKASYKYLNILLNTTFKNYSSVSFEISEQGGQSIILTSQSTQYYGLSYKYGQIDLSLEKDNGEPVFESGKTYNIYVNAILNGSSINYTLSIQLTD